MSNVQEHWDDDIDWLLDMAAKDGKRPTEAQQHDFADQVRSALVRGGVNLDAARRGAFRRLYG